VKNSLLLKKKLAAYGTEWRAGRFAPGVLSMTVTRSSKTKAPNVAAPDPKAVEAIGRALKAHYAELVDAPLTERLVELLARFEVEDPIPEPKRGGDAIG
jgi:Anti-sigma factor NepR